MYTTAARVVYCFCLPFSLTRHALFFLLVVLTFQPPCEHSFIYKCTWFREWYRCRHSIYFILFSLLMLFIIHLVFVCSKCKVVGVCGYFTRVKGCLHRNICMLPLAIPWQSLHISPCPNVLQHLKVKYNLLYSPLSPPSKWENVAR